jgi:hypothetical protein
MYLSLIRIKIVRKNPYKPQAVHTNRTDALYLDGSKRHAWREEKSQQLHAEFRGQLLHKKKLPKALIEESINRLCVSPMPLL